MTATGLSDGTYKLGDLEVFVKDSVATLADGTLAGSAMNLFGMLTNLIKIGVKPEKAIKSVTSIPADSVGLGDVCGKIKEGRKADMIVLNENFEIEHIIFNGEIISC